MSNNTGTQVAIIPAGFQLPAHLQSPEAQAAAAAIAAAAAGGIKAGGFPRISIKGGKFHIVENGETTTIMQPAQPGQPALPMMLLEAVIVGANPALSKTYYEGDWEQGDAKEPDCSSEDGVTPDAHIPVPQSGKCATCPQNQWGSKISKATGKEVKACSDNKRLVVLPAKALDYKAMALNITPSSLKDWGGYVKALSGRNIPVNAVVTNITFDANASHPKLVFSFGRVLSAEEYAKVQQRAQGDDVKTIVSPVRSIGLPAPATAPAQPAAVAAAPAVQVPPAVTAPAAAAPVQTGSGGTPQAPTEPKRQRAPRRVPEAVQQATQQAANATAAHVTGTAATVIQAIQETVKVDPLAHLPAHIRATVEQFGKDSDIGKMLLAQNPAPAAPAATPPAAPVTGFGAGATVVTPPAAAASAAATATAGSLAAQLAARLKQHQPAGN